MVKWIGISAMVMLAQAVCANTEIVTIQIQQQTSFGDSVFALADHPVLGAGQIRRAIKLSPHEYPLWSVQVEVPRGVRIPVSFYLRADAANRLTDGGNGTLLPTTQMIETIGDPPAPKAVEVLLAPSVNQASALITAQVPGFSAATVPFERTTETVGGRVVFRGSIPGDHISHGRLWQLRVDGANRFSAPVRLNGAPFRWIDGDSTTSAPRRESFTFQLTGYPSRTIRVLLPRGYDQNPDRRYPVLYAQDGQNVLSPGGAFGSWDMDIAVERLTREGEIPEIILVAIDNTNARLEEYRPSWTTYQNRVGTGDGFLAAIRDQLIPEINQRYRTLTGPEHTSHVGSSLGGILGWEAAHRFANTFGAVAIMSPSFWLNPERVLQDAALSPDRRARVWLDSGVAGTSDDGYANVVTTRDRMLEAGSILGTHFAYQFGYFQTGAAIEPGHQHNEAAWRARTPDMLRWMYAPLMRGEEGVSAATSNLWMITGSAAKAASDRDSSTP